MISKKLIWLMALTLISLMSAQATIRPVPGQYARIQHAVDFANDGDTILIAPNTYTGPGNREVLILNKGLTIMGDGDASSVIIHVDDSNHYRAFAVIDPPSAVRFENLTIENAWGWDSEMPYTGSGSGIRFRNASVEINNCRFIYCFGIDGGGALYFEGSTVGINNCVFDSCAGDLGGALYCDSATTCTILNSSFANGVSAEAGGAILADGATLEIRNCEFVRNRALSGPFGVGGYGGTIYVRFGGFLKIDNCSFLHNSTYAYGGAVLSSNSTVEIDRSLFEGNLVRCTQDFQGNLIGSGGAVYHNGGSCAISACSFVGNYSRCSFPAVYISAQSATVHQSIIAESDTGSAFGGYADFTCSNIFGNDFGDWTGSIAGQLGQNGNISEDPLFCGAIPGDYRISSSSPCAASNNDCGLTMGSEAVGCDVICGDADFSGNVTVSDAIFLITYIFANGEPPMFIETADVDCNSLTNISDVVYLISYIFSGGLSPCSACP